MFEATSDVSEVSAEEIVTRDAKRYQVRSGQTICIAQVEVVGKGLLERKDELLDAMRRERDEQGPALYALMITDVLEQGHRDARRRRRRRGGAGVRRRTRQDSTIELPGRDEPQEGSRAEAAAAL